MKVKIISAPTSLKCWYKDKIGQIFDVTIDNKPRHGSAPYKVPNIPDVWCIEEAMTISAVRYIRREDCEEVKCEN